MADFGMRRSGGTYRFGPYALAADGTLLERDGDAVPLPPKVLRTLLTLVERAGQVVTKSDLLEAVWPDTIIEETGLSRNVSLLRHALSSEHRPYIVTVARIGYRFVGSVEYHERAERARERVAPRLGSAERSVAEPAVVLRPPPPRRADSRLIVGRDQEFRRLAAALSDTRFGRGRLVGLAGEPGIGKSTIIEKFLDDAGSECFVGRGRCSQRLSGAEPHLPLLEVLEQLASDPAVMPLFRRVAPTWEHAIGPVRNITSESEAAHARPASSVHRLFREIAAFFEELSRRAPVAVILEDLHWADAATIDVLAHLAPRLERMGVLIAVTYRPHELTSVQHPFKRLRLELLAGGCLQEVAVRLLRLPDVHEYLARTLPSASESSELAEIIHARTEGNPLFMVELVKELQERGVTATTIADITGSLPGSLAAMVERALAALDPDARRLLSVAAVQGHQFDSAILAEVFGGEGVVVEDQLRTCEEVHGVLIRDREAALPDDTPSIRYRFAHVLYQESLYAGITPLRRVEWAGQIAASLIRSYGRVLDPIAGRVAVLLETGLEFWGASGYYATASTNAARRFAFHEAGELASRGLACLRRAAAPDRSAQRCREAELTFARYIALASLSGYGNAELEALMERLGTLSDADRDGPATASSLATTWGVRMARGECAAAKEAAMRLGAIAALSEDDALAMNARMQLQLACHHLGEFAEAQEQAAAVAAAAPRIRASARLLTVFDPVVASLAESSRNLWITGHLRRAMDDAAAAVALAVEVAHADSLAFAWLFHGWLHGYRGDWNAALEAVNTGLHVAREAALAQTVAWNQCVRGWVQAHLGHTEDGMAELADGIQASRRIMGWVAMPQFSAMTAEVLLLREQPDAAVIWLGEALDFMESHRDLYFGAEVYRLLAVCRFAQKQDIQAMEYLHRALHLARSQQARTFELRTALTFAQRRPEEGAGFLREALLAFPDPQPWREIVEAATLCGLSVDHRAGR